MAIREEGARKCDTLPFAARKLHAPLADERAIAARQTLDELMRIRKPRSALDFRHARAGTRIRDVLGKAAMKQDRLLLHDRDLGAQ